ncbi:GGDEF domain-containing protein [Casimicrobium huifangae]|uniref:GGDEF domain-containing protein n=1 Tax=Casimicrobium huifangae TaxID=2591109 RepID=UPI0012EB71E9|nr:GGDEF domain-containing protein [Casimicrobium huifangae]
MLKLFQKSSLRGEGSPDGIALAEQALLAEALLQTSAQLIGRPDPAGMARRYCEAIVSASPNICMAWVWFGDPNATVVEPQVAVGPAILAEKRLSIGADFFASPRSMAVLTTSGVPTRTFDLSPTATHGPWRAAASRYGARSVLIAPISSGGDERGLLAVYSTRARYFESTSAGLFQTVAQLLHAVLASSRQQADRLPDEASDLVTGLANRRHARRTLEEQWNLESEHATRGVLAIVALDGFRGVNDRFGRLVGNLALRDVAQALLGNVRRTDMVSRWGGDQFLLWQPGMAASNAGAIAEKLRAAVAALAIPSDQAAGEHLHASIAVTQAPAGEPLVSVLDRVDRALHRAKQSGRNCVIVARPDI